MTNRNQWTPVWIMLAGFFVVLVGLILAMYTEYRFGAVFSLVGSLILAVGGVMAAVISKRAKRT